MCRALNYFKHFLIFVSSISDCDLISTISSLVDVPIGIASFTVRLKICAITAGIKKYKAIIKKKRIKCDKILLLGKAKLGTIEVVISKALIDSCISYDEFFSINNVSREYNKTKEDIKNPRNALEYAI